MGWLNRIAAIARSRKLERDLDEELQLHIELKTRDNIAAGMSPEEAHYAALRAFGSVEQKKEECRDADRLRWIEDVIQDIRYGLRQLRRNPGFTAVAILTLAFGIGANTAMFSVIYGVLLRPLPYPHPKRIVQISLTYRGELESYSGFYAGGFDYWREHHRPFQYLAASTGVGFNLTGVGHPERIDALRVSTQFFDVYGVQPFLGRSFSSSEDRLGGPNVAVLSYGLWKSRFNGDRGVIGHTILLDGAPFNIIGVMPAGFETIPPVALWTTIGQVRSTVGNGQNYHLIGRLKPSVSVEQASSYLTGLAQPFFATPSYRGMQSSNRKALSLVAEPYRYVISKDVRTPLLVLFGAIGFVLLIACANVANLILSRAAARNREIALRTALGAGRSRIVRQFLTESLLVAIMGAVLGLWVAFWGLVALLSLAPDVLPRAQHVGLNGWALIFTAGVAILAGLLSGLVPALTASHTSLNEALKEGAGGSGLGVQRRRLSAAMVSAEAALSLVLLIGCGLLVRTFANLLSTDPGFDPYHMLTLQVSTKGSQYKSMPALASYYQRVVGRIDAIPGVKSAAIVAAGSPLEGGGNVNPEVRVGDELKRPSVDYREITPGFFRALGVPLVAGRAFTEGDSSGSTNVTIVNKAFAIRYFHNQNPVGRHFVLWQHDLEIVGVAGDVRSTLNEPAPPTLFIPMTQASFAGDQLFQGWFPTTILVRTSLNPLALSHEVQKAVREVDPNTPVSHVMSMERILSLSIARQRFLMVLMGVFATLALVLALVGLYGVISYSVTQRTHEIGIRVALGAERSDVLRMVVGQGLKLALIGVVIGIAGALELTRFLASLLYGVKPTDPLTFIAVSLILIAVALLACYIPARRAAKVDPMVALRYE